MKIARWLAAVALCLACAGFTAAQGGTTDASALSRAQALSASAASAADEQTSATLASAAMDGRSPAATRASAVAGKLSEGTSGLAATLSSGGASQDLRVPSPISWMNRPRPASAKPGFMHRFTRTRGGELFFLGFVIFAIATAGMIGGAALAVAALGPGSGLAGGLAGSLVGFFLGAKAARWLEK